MAKTKIEYGDRTWNPLTGCTMVSEGCVHCWAQTMAKRLKAMGRPEYQHAVDENGRWTGIIRLVHERLKEPFTWRKPQHVLVEYMGDLFHPHVPVPFVWDVFDVMKKTPQHTYQTLTKRPEAANVLLALVEPMPHVIFGCTVENQKRADERLPAMRALAEAGWRTWVSYEPALGAVNWKGWEFLNQLVAGGESGPGARPMHPDWARSARDWCVVNDVPFFFKQWGDWMPIDQTLQGYSDTLYYPAPENNPTAIQKCKVDTAVIQLDGSIKNEYPKGAMLCFCVGKKKSGRVLDGREWKDMPAPLPAASPHLEERKMGGDGAVEEVRDETE